MFNYPMSFMSSNGVATNLSYANFPYSGVLPTMYTNFGGDLQCTTIDPYNGYNLGILFNPIAAQTYGVPAMYANNYMSTPTDVTAAAASQAQQILTPIYNNMASGQINSASNLLNCAKTQLQAKLNSENTSDEEKQEVQQVLDKLEALEERLNTLKESTESLDSQTAYEQARDINNEISSTIREAQKAAVERENAAQQEQQNQGSTPTDQDPTSTDQDSIPTSQGSTQTTQGTTPTNQSAQGNDGVGDGSVDNFPVALRNDAKAFYDAIDGLGTDDDKMEQILDAYTASPDAMVGLMLCWNEDQSAKDKESFIEAFMNDATHGQKKKYCEMMANALAEKARELGIYDAEFRKYKDAVIDEADDCVINNGTVSKNMDAMLELIGNKLGSKFSTKS